MSQSEIDNLLSALSAGEVDTNDIDDSKQKKIKQYDFRRPDKFAKEQLRTIEIIHENLSRHIGNFLSAYLRSTVDIGVVSTESMVYSEFNNSISDPAIICVIDFTPLEGHILLEIGRDLAFAIIERVLGGLGKNPIPKEKRAITEIEETLIRGIVDQICFHIREAWGNIIELTPSLDKIETNSQFAQLFSPSESIALVTYNVELGDSEGLINIAIPHIVIEPILPNLSSKYWFTGSMKKEKTPGVVELLKHRLNKSKLEVKAVIGTATVTVTELLSLAIGDIVVLDKCVNSELDVFVAGKLKYKSIPGLNKKNLAIKITEVVDEKSDYECFQEITLGKLTESQVGDSYDTSDYAFIEQEQIDDVDIGDGGDMENNQGINAELMGAIDTEMAYEENVQGGE